MPMQPVQIANSGVTPGRYGNNKQIPVFNVDQRGRLTFAANVDIESNLTVIADNETHNTKHINLNSDYLKFFSGNGIKIRLVNDDTFEFSINEDRIRELVEDEVFENRRLESNIVSGSLKMVDVDNRILSNGTLSIKGNEIAGGYIEIGNGLDYDRATVKIIGSSKSPSLEVTSPSSGFSCANIDLTSYKNSFQNQETLQNNDSLGQIRFNGFIKTPGGNDTANLALINSSLIQESDGISTLPQVKIDFICMNGPDVTQAKIASFDNKGTFSAPVLKTGIYSDTSSRDNSIPSPEMGMIVFISSSGKFQGNVDGTISGWRDLN